MNSSENVDHIMNFNSSNDDNFGNYDLFDSLDPFSSGSIEYSDIDDVANSINDSNRINFPVPIQKTVLPMSSLQSSFDTNCNANKEICENLNPNSSSGENNFCCKVNDHGTISSMGLTDEGGSLLKINENSVCRSVAPRQMIGFDNYKTFEFNNNKLFVESDNNSNNYGCSKNFCNNNCKNCSICLSMSDTTTEVSKLCCHIMNDPCYARWPNVRDEIIKRLTCFSNTNGYYDNCVPVYAEKEYFQQCKNDYVINLYWDKQNLDKCDSTGTYRFELLSFLLSKFKEYELKHCEINNLESHCLQDCYTILQNILPAANFQIQKIKQLFNQLRANVNNNYCDLNILMNLFDFQFHEISGSNLKNQRTLNPSLDLSRPSLSCSPSLSSLKSVSSFANWSPKIPIDSANSEKVLASNNGPTVGIFNNNLNHIHKPSSSMQIINDCNCKKNKNHSMQEKKNRSKGKIKGSLPKEVIQFLKTWFRENRYNPYPTESQKKELATKLNITNAQVNYWLINARVRLWPRMIGSEFSNNPHLFSSTAQRYLKRKKQK